jgi:hypothetical protein
VLRSSWNTFDTKDSTNGKEPIKTPKKQRLNLGARKLRGSDIN